VIVAAVDSAASPGIAIVERAAVGAERLISYGLRPLGNAADVERLAVELAATRPDVTAIEQPFLHVGSAVGLNLAVLHGRLLQAFERRGLPTVAVPTDEWQQSGLLPGIHRGSRGVDRKRASRAFAMTAFGVLVGENEGDAIALATWVARSPRARRRAAG
jgi:hypothetical protein